MKKNLLILLTLVFAFRLAAQRKPNLNTITRKPNLYKSNFNNDYSGSFTFGILRFKGELDQTTKNKSISKNITLNKRLSESWLLSTKVSFGELHGQGILYDWDYEITSNYQFENYFSAYSILLKKQINRTRDNKSSSFRINTAVGLGVITSKVNSRPDNTLLIEYKDNFNTFFIPFTLDFEYFITPKVGLIITSELNYCFSDAIDLAAEFNLDNRIQIKNLSQFDIFTGYTAGICIKLE